MKDYTNGVLDIIRRELEAIMGADVNYYKQFNFVLSNEQQFVEKEERNYNTIYIVVKFLQGTPFYGQLLLPITITAVGEANDIEACQRLLSEFANQYNLNDQETIENALTKQIYSTPQVISNFSEVYEGFRSLFYMTGTILVGENNNPIVGATVTNINNDGTEYEIEFLSAHWSFDNQIDSQAFTGTHNRTKSEAKIYSLTISFVLYLKNDDFCNSILRTAFRNLIASGQNNQIIRNNNFKYIMNITMANGDKYQNPFVLVNASGQQNIGEFPAFTATFTC